MKQQYGIHLATRLQADGDGKEAKWADIDDDEDDWVPETIEWNDGTKVNLAHNDSSTTLVDDQAATAAAAAAKEQEEAAKKAKVPPPKPVTTVGPNATVLRLGSNSQPRTGGLVLKTPSDKPTLVAKPSAPTPVRSPWAPLPPVDKVPPVPINPPTQTATSRFQQNESHGTDISTAPLSTTVEIPADSFTRTRRDTQAGTHGQLYNSQSGQYETVSAPRRGSIRKDQNFRPPSLLQRPSPSDQQGPAEPPPAFQTHRSGIQQDHSLWSRRESSTISNENGPQGRRASISKSSDIPRVPLELLQQRRESQPLQSPLTSGHLQGRPAQGDIHGAQNQYTQPSQSGVNSQLPQDVNSANITSQPQMTVPSGNTTASHIVKDIAAQKQLMHEKRELAIKRKKEEEEREQAERRERIRIRMEKLGLPPLVEKKESEKVTVEQISQEVKHSENKVLEPKTAKPNEVPAEISENKPQEAVAPAPRSPPKPPVPDSSGTPKQYGLMKLHGPTAPLHLSKGRVPESRPKTVLPVEQTAPIEQNGRSEQHAPAQQNVPTVQESASVQEKFTEPKISPSKANLEIGGKGSEFVATTHSETLVENKNGSRIDNIHQDLFNGPRHPKPWNSIQNEEDAFASWNGAAGMTTHSSPGGNLWGPPNSFKSLGNGTFDRSVQRPQSRPLTYQENYLPTQPAQPPQPIGPPKHLQRPRESPESNHISDHSPTAVAEDFQTIPTFPSSDAPSSHLATRPDNLNQTSRMEISNPSPQPHIPVPAKPTMNTERVSHPQEYTRTTLAAWGTFHITSAKEDQEKRRQAAHEEALRLAEEERTGIRRQLELPAMNETWRQVKVDDHGSHRQVVSVARNLTSASSQQMNGDITNPAYSNPTNLIAPSGTGRGSRFFPTGQNIPAHDPQAVSYSTTYSRIASPPPPESENHPAYLRDHQRPLVNLPISRPRPTVRLPPPGVTSLHPPVLPVLPSVQAVPLRAISQPLVNNPSWQDRFDGLLGNKKPQAEKKPIHVNDFSATKVPLDVPIAQVSTAVALPPKEEKITQPKYDGGVTSKETEDEEALFENREFGSLPTVLIPAKAPESVQQSLKSGKNGKNFHNRVGRYKEVDSETVKNLEDKASEGPNGLLIFVKMTGMDEKRSATMPRAKNNNNSNMMAQRNRHISSGSKPGKGFKARESNGTFNQKVAPIGAQRIAMPNGVIPQPRNQFPKQNPHWNSNTRVVPTAQ